jgi:hypothetical protein
MSDIDRRVIEGRESPEDDVYVLLPNGGIAWADNADDAMVVEKEIENGNTETDGLT